MKKIFAIILVLLILLAFQSCSGKPEADPIVFKPLNLDPPVLREPTEVELALVEQFLNGEDDSRAKAKTKLLDMGKDAVPALVQALTQQGDLILAEIGDLLGEIGPDAVDASFSLVELLGNYVTHATCSEPYPVLSFHANEALLNIGISTLPALVWGLRNEKSSIRDGSGITLGDFGADAKDAVPYLIPSISDEEFGINCYAVEALGKIGPAAKSAVPEIISILAEGEDWDKGYAIRALGGIGPDACEAVPALVEEIKLWHEWPNYDAIEALGNIATRETIPTLMDLLRNSPRFDRPYIAESLYKIGADKNTVLSELLEILKYEKAEIELIIAKDPDHIDYDSRHAKHIVACSKALEVLSLYGPLADEAIPLIEDILEMIAPDEQIILWDFTWLAISAIGALRNILPDPAELIPRLNGFLKSDVIYLRWRAAYSLSVIGPESAASVNLLIIALNDEFPDVRYNAAWALGEIGPGAESSLPWLEVLVLNDRNGEVRSAAKDAIQKIAGEQTGEWSDGQLDGQMINAYSIWPAYR